MSLKATRTRNDKLISTIAGMGLPAVLVSTLLEMNGHRPSLDDGRFLRGPIIYHQTAWSDTIPKWMFDQVREERAEIAAGALRMPVGPTEIAVVMYSRTFEAPMPYHMTQLYLWATANACARHYKKPLSEYWKMLDMRPIDDSEVLSERGELAHEYRFLSQEIRRKVISHQAGRERDEVRRRTKAELLGNTSLTKPNESIDQLPLFRRRASAE